ncbi:MAG: carboxylate-amine ligase [Pseudomonadota bacterium]
MVQSPSFTMGVEEEYWLVDKDSGDLIEKQPPELMQDMIAVLGEQVTKEFHGSQIEIGTKICSSSKEVHDELVRLRGTIAEIAQKYDLAIIASSTHPSAEWDRQGHSEGDHYESLVQDFQQVILRLLICGMHVHVGIEDEDLRMDLLNQMTYFLPHLLAISTSSPFWRGKNMGLHSYRLSLFDNLPRSGLPERFESYSEYQRFIDILVDSKAIDNPAKIWWDLRPSMKWPTLEMRVTDICTNLQDAVCLASITRCLFRAMYRLRCQNLSWRKYPNTLINQNRWMAQRYGTTHGLIDIGRGEIRPYKELVDELVEIIEPDIEHFGCADEVMHVYKIIEQGTSAQKQVAVYEQALEKSGLPSSAIFKVKQFLMRETLLGT